MNFICVVITTFKDWKQPNSLPNVVGLVGDWLINQSVFS